MTTDPTSLPLTHAVPGASDILVERNYTYGAESGPLAFDLYRPAQPGPHGAVVFVTGYPDPGAVALFGKPFREWASFVGWARMMAASGVAGITYENHEPKDGLALVRHLRANAASLGLDPTRIGLWAASGNAPTALAMIASERITCAALLYAMTLDYGGSTHVADAAAKFRFAVSPVTFDDLPRDTPILVVRAGRDELPGLDASLVRFVTAARERGMAVTLVEHEEAPHAFDLGADTPRTHEVIDEVITFLATHLRVS